MSDRCAKSVWRVSEHWKHGVWDFWTKNFVWPKIVLDPNLNWYKCRHFSQSLFRLSTDNNVNGPLLSPIFSLFIFLLFFFSVCSNQKSNKQKLFAAPKNLGVPFSRHQWSFWGPWDFFDYAGGVAFYTQGCVALQAVRCCRHWGVAGSVALQTV